MRTNGIATSVAARYPKVKRLAPGVELSLRESRALESLNNLAVAGALF